MVLPELVRLTPVFQAGCPVQYQGDAEPIARLEIDSTKPSSSSINSTGKSLVQNFQAVKSLETKQDPPKQSQVERRKVFTQGHLSQLKCPWSRVIRRKN